MAWETTRGIKGASKCFPWEHLEEEQVWGETQEFCVGLVKFVMPD